MWPAHKLKYKNHRITVSTQVQRRWIESSKCITHTVQVFPVTHNILHRICSNKQTDVNNILSSIGGYLSVSNASSSTQSSPKKIQKKRSGKRKRRGEKLDNLQSTISNNSSSKFKVQVDWCDVDIVASPVINPTSCNELYCCSSSSSEHSSCSESESDHDSERLDVISDIFKQKDLENTMDTLAL